MHLGIYPRHPLATPGPPTTIAGRPTPTLRVPPEAEAELFATSFDQAVAALGQMPRCFMEPDGSFVAVGGEGAARWQLDGQLWDGGPGLAYVEVRGEFPRAEFQSLLTIVGWPQQPLAVLLIEQGVLIDADDFLPLLG